MADALVYATRLLEDRQREDSDTDLNYLTDTAGTTETRESAVIVDLATLTGACVVALGEQYAAAYSDSSELMDRLTHASEVCTVHIHSLYIVYIVCI